jgi:hypothetical protein
MTKFKIIPMILMAMFCAITSFAGDTSDSSININFKVISYRLGKKKESKAFIRKANMMIALTLNMNNEPTYMSNRWVNYLSASYGDLVKTEHENQYLWKPTNNYNSERNTCIVTTYEVKKWGKSIRIFEININHGKEKLVIVAERM